MWRRIQKFLATFVPALVLLIYLGVVVCLLNRWDAVVAVTLIPVWIWGVAGMLVSLLSWLAFRGFPSLLAFCLWFVTAVVASEETYGLAREFFFSTEDSPEEEHPSREVLRVANIDAGDDADTIHRLAELEPDIVTIQNAPDEGAVIDAADELYGVERTVVVHRGNAIIARGEFLDTMKEDDSSTVHARLRLAGGFIVDVTNVDLEPCLPRRDIWRPRAWSELSEARSRDRRLLREYLGENQLTRGTTGRIVAGGFGTPPGDDVFRPLENADLVDTWAASGRGWGNTFPSRYAFLRVDQIWVSLNLEPLRSVTHRNPNATHRTVLSELAVPRDDRSR